MAMELCKKYNLLSPLYGFSRRGGCWFCPNAKNAELKHLRKEHKELWQKLLELENEKELAGTIWNTLTKTSLAEKEAYFLAEEKQITIFDIK